MNHVYRLVRSDVEQCQAPADDGNVLINRNPRLVGNNERRLSGTGMGATFSDEQMRVDLLLVAWKVGSGVPISDVNRSSRVWLQAIRYFR